MVASHVRNRLLLKLGDAERDAVLQAASLRTIPGGEVLEQVDQPAKAVYFPESGLASMLAVLTDGSTIEAAAIGIDGFVGTRLLLGNQRSTTRTIWQVPGDAYVVPAVEFATLLEGLDLKATMLASVQDTLGQMMQVVGCNRRHDLEQRCARWLLMTHDRVEGRTFELTQEFLSLMLGVDRPNVSTIMGRLRDQGLIDYVRGVVTIVDRAGLEATVCECYAVLAETFPGPMAVAS